MADEVITFELNENYAGRYQRFGGIYCPEDGSIMFLQNIGIYLQDCTALQLRRPISTFLLSREPKIS
jgi:hypothetical protein